MGIVNLLRLLSLSLLLSCLSLSELPATSARLVHRSTPQQPQLLPLLQRLTELHTPASPLSIRSASSPSSPSPTSPTSFPASAVSERLPPSFSSLSPLLAPLNCSVAADWQLPLNLTNGGVIYNLVLTPACQVLYVTVWESNTPDADTYIASVDLATGVEQWRLPLPYNGVDFIGLIPPFFQLNAAGSMLFAQHVLETLNNSCVEMWGIAIQKTAGKVMWRVSQCFPQTATDIALTFPGGLLFPDALSDGAAVDDVVLLLPGSFVVFANGSCGDFLPWTSIRASTGEVLHAEAVPIAPFAIYSSLQSDGHYFSVQGLNVTTNITAWNDVTSVFSMSNTGVFALQSSRTYDPRYTLMAVTASDTMMQGFLSPSDDSVSSWVGWSVPEQKQRWQRSDDAILMWRWPTEDADTVWQWIGAHPLNSSWSVATTIGAAGGGDVWVIVAIFDTHTGDRIATSAVLGPQAADDSGYVYPKPARLINTDQGPRLLQTLQEGAYVLDVHSLTSLYSGKAVKNDMNPYVLWMEGPVASLLRFRYDYFTGGTMTLNATRSTQVD